MDPALLHRSESRCRVSFESLVEESALEAPSVTVRHENGVEVYSKPGRCLDSLRHVA